MNSALSIGFSPQIVALWVQAAGTAEGQKDAEEDFTTDTAPNQAQGPQQAQQGIQEGPQAPPQGQQSSFGVAEPGQGGAPMPSSGHEGGQQKADAPEQKESNPYRHVSYSTAIIVIIE